MANSHTQYMNVTSYFTTAVNITFDFDSAVNWYSIERKESGVWVDRTAGMTTYVSNGRYYYTFMNVAVTANQVMETRWNFKPTSGNKAGKYNVLFWKGNYLSPTVYVNLDPYWGLYNINDFARVQNKTTTANQIYSLVFKEDGSRMILAEYASATDVKYKQYTLSTPWNVTTAVNTNNYTLNRYTNTTGGTYIDSTGTKLFRTTVTAASTIE
jgi:hypothetical protein